MNTGISYDLFYEILSELREEFHKNGRFDDSNSKLDEITKLLFISFHEAKNKSQRFNLEYLRRSAESNFGDKTKVASALNLLFKDVASNSIAINDDGSNIFGSNPNLNIQESDNEFAEKLISELTKIDFDYLHKEESFVEFDMINEYFGHFVRDNFRNNKEDAQYMTPQEITKPLLDMIFNDIFNEDFEENVIDNEENFIIMDPTCGVGTLLIEPLRYVLRYIDGLEGISEEKKKRLVDKILKEGVIGQDKVDRMVRLSKINMMFMGGEPNNIYSGNSIMNGSHMDESLGKVDLIVTNPPFGANYHIDDFLDDKHYTILKESRFNGLTIPSELILLDRCLTHLKPSGKLAIIIPDSVVSAGGLYEIFREELLKHSQIKAVVELPSVTFAQAGTRTKTSIVYLEKKIKKDNNFIFMATCETVGYDVRSRKGAPVKIKDGENQMYDISKCYIEKYKSQDSDFTLLNEHPSCTFIKEKFIQNTLLNPNFYNHKRLRIIKNIETIDTNKFKIYKLNELVSFVNKTRKSMHVNGDIRHISVLHVDTNDGLLNFKEIENFEPVSKGREVFPGDIIFSKINPRIPRIAVVPEYEKKLVCSNEFEIMRANKGVDTYLIYSLLKLEMTQEQILSSTSGTSSSHNRIKTQQLEEILIAYPIGEKIKSDFTHFANTIEEMTRVKYHSNQKVLEMEELISSTLTNKVHQ